MSKVVALAPPSVLTSVRAGLRMLLRMAQPTDPISQMLAELEQWLREEVAPVAASGANWKAILNGKGTDWNFVVEKHGGRKQMRLVLPPRGVNSNS